ncbi:agglutinin biogenesis protein MshQ [Alteromonas mediterranea]|uniref:H-type lectin domain-containing protein n=1 Tax=Alteromonas mediterranea TaxID=314275 RepID=UPI000904468A|nr:H-type lectin domain-containing protein [Alteromonas mediterranea]APD92725.1 agglutinin biogenesis protein MshQ [Alteromonas mediterranea]APD96339.1 agglutinin biogenesis protein MshQ [Alteromonas mediterranea]
MTYRKSLVRALLAWVFSILALPTLAVPQIEGRFIELQNTYNKAEWTTISFSQVYDEPPAVFMLSTNQGGNPAIVKIRNVTRTGFEALPLEPSGEDGPHITMGGHYLAIAYGIHEFPDGDIVEVGKMELDADTIQASTNSPWYAPTGPLLPGTEDTRYAQVPLQTDFGEQPVFFHSIQTVNNQVDVNGKKPPNEHLLPFLTIAAKYEAPSYYIAFEASETDYEPVTRTETVAYMATTEGFDRSFFDDNGVEVVWEADFADVRIQGWDDGCFQNNFKNKYDQTPLVAASKISRNGADGGWLRSCQVNKNRLGLRVDEDRSLDSERNHTEEDASILAMTSEFVFSGEVPSCDVAFPGAVAAFGGSAINLPANSRIIDENSGVLSATQLIPGGTPGTADYPKCGEPGVDCTVNNTDSLTESQSRAIPTITIDDSGPEIAAGNLAGDYYFNRQNVLMAAGNYNVVAPTRIYVSDPGTNPAGQPTRFVMANANVTVADGAYLAIYVDGDVVIDGSNPRALVIAKGTVTFANVGDETLIGRFNAGGGIESVSSTTASVPAPLRVTANSVPNNIPGICGREVIEVLNHYRYELADNKGSSCAAKEITLKACADVNCDLIYSQPSTVNLSPKNNNNFQWSGSDTVSFIGQISLALDSLKGNDTKLATLGETPSSQLRCFIGGKDVGIEGCKINFEDDGLVFKNLTDNNTTIVSQLSGKPSDQGFNSKTYAVEACGSSEFLKNKIVDVDLNYSCSSSSNCSNKLALSNDNNTYELGLTPETVALQFDGNSRAEFSVQYPDAGELSLSGTITDRTSISGSSNIFKVRPFGFAMDILNDSGTSTNLNGYANSANGTLLKRTGEDFVVGLRTVQWVDGEDSNNDGVPDNFDDLANNNTAEHFTGTVTLAPQQRLPVGGTTGALSISSVVFDDEGKVDVSLNYDEVGTISINAQSTYLTDTTVLGQVNNVGRFAPSNFALTGSVDAACTASGAFTYFDQPLADVSFSLTALNHNGSRTVNYYDGFDKLTNLSLQVEHVGSLLNRLANTSAITWPQNASAGQISYSDSDIAFSRLSGATLDGAYLDANIVLVAQSSQLDGANFNGLTCSGICVADIGGAVSFAYGRATLINNYGGADEALLLPMRTQYWDGNNWRINSYDSCTGFEHDNINDNSSELVSSENGNLSEGAYEVGTGMRVSSPNGAGNYPVTYTPDAWLLWDWDGDGQADNPPSATLTYGVYRGNDNIIYKREQINNE